MSYPVIGQNIQLEVTEGQYLGRYTCRVQDMEKNALYVDLPIRQDAPEGARPVVLPDRLTVVARYRAVDGASCMFVTHVTGRTKRQIELLELQKPPYSDVHRQQRREFLRVPINVPMDLVYIPALGNELITSRAESVDISGGGLSFRVKDTLPIQANDVIGFTFDLPTETGPARIVGKARVIRVAQPNEHGLKHVSLKYWEINEADRQRIVQYSFKRQIEMRERGVLG